MPEGSTISRCGGALVGKRTVITAAHCLHGKPSARVYFGIRDVTTRGNAQQQTVSASNWRVHEDYDDATSKNDVALINLPKDVNVSASVGFVSPSWDDKSYDNTQAVVAGWGMVNDNDGTNILRFANLKVAPAAQCEPIFGSYSTGNMLCMDASSGGTCRGDAGGPLLINDNGTPKLIGIVSFGAARCAHTFSRVATRIPSYGAWIKRSSTAPLT
ncbi:S1 family peptidase [Embleya sp. NPDC059237]|uniref:S1 family peptidase n=1 Tax=Embleya sp. NPDC059237 TaxID=3346784 RepID=UPI0036AE2E31